MWTRSKAFLEIPCCFSPVLPLSPSNNTVRSQCRWEGSYQESSWSAHYCIEMTSLNGGLTPTTAFISDIYSYSCVDALRHCIDKHTHTHTHVTSSGLAVRYWKTRDSSYSGGSRTADSNHWKSHLKPLLSIPRIQSLMSSSGCGPERAPGVLFSLPCGLNNHFSNEDVVFISHSCSETSLRSATAQQSEISRSFVTPKSQTLQKSCWVRSNIYHRQEDTDFTETPLSTFSFRILRVWRHVHSENILCTLT